MSKLLSVTDRKTDAIEALPTAQKILLAVAIAKTRGGNVLDPLEVQHTPTTTLHNTQQEKTLIFPILASKGIQKDIRETYRTCSPYGDKL